MSPSQIDSTSQPTSPNQNHHLAFSLNRPHQNTANSSNEASLSPFKTSTISTINFNYTSRAAAIIMFLLAILLMLVNTIQVSHSAVVLSSASSPSEPLDGSGGGNDLWLTKPTSGETEPAAAAAAAFVASDEASDDVTVQNKDNNQKNYHGQLKEQRQQDIVAAGAASNQWLPSGDVSDHSNLGSTLNKSLTQLENQHDELTSMNESNGSGGGGSLGSGGLGGLRRQLIRQLTSLIMNHEPERIAEKMEGTRVSGQLVSESELLEDGTTIGSNLMSSSSPLESSVANTLVSEIQQQQHQYRTAASERPSMLVLFGSDRGNSGEDDNSIQDTIHPEDREVNDNDTADESSNNSNNPQSSSTAEEQYVTCPPDYEDSSIIVESASNNLTMEQQQQLLAGADSSGLLTMNGSTSGSTPDAGNGQDPEAARSSVMGSNGGQNPRASQGPCIMPGSRMIEVITKVITPILFSIIIVVGLVGNIIVMIVILEDRKTERELTPTGLLILDLSLADLSFIIFCIPFTAWDYSVGHWVFGSLWCKFNQYLIVVCALSSIYTLVLMSVDRFMAIVYPIECMSYRTSKNTLYAIYIKWILILAMASPTIAMHGLIDSPAAPDQFTCRFLSDQYNPLHFQIIFFITSYLFPLILIFCLYLSLLNKLWFGSKPHGHKESLKTLESKKKVTWLVAGIVVVFALCWCPIQVMLILMRLRTHKITATYVAIQVFSHTLGYMNSCVNPIVYAFASESFLNSFKRSSMGRFFYMCFCCKNSHQLSGNSNNNNNNNNNNHNNHHNNSNHDRNSNPTNFRFIHHNSSNATTTALTNAQQQQRPTHLLQQDNPKPPPIDPIGRVSSTLINRHAPGRMAIEDTNQMGGTPISADIPSSELPTNGYNETKMVSLPLEPRDRLVAHCGTLDSSMGSISREMGGMQESFMGGQMSSTSISGLQQQQLGPAKQQLVAHMVQSGKQVSHRCEPCYQQELLESSSSHRN